MIIRRPAEERGRTALDWLDSRHSFSFDRYYDPQHMGFRHLRVLNDDRVKPGAGFGMHSHRDMEIITYILDGALEHQDSLGNKPVIRPGEVQRMTAGTGVTHAEFNHSQSEPVHFLQIWILPERRGLPPSFEQRAFPAEGKRGRWRLIAARDARDGALSVHQDAALYATVLARGEALTHEAAPDRHAWLQVARGAVTVNGQSFGAGDGAAISQEDSLVVKALEPSELLLFDLA
jgi:redox-sensitive bicupin YhaK (pirin superfamily)